jgi:hypothetical protein
VNDDLYLQVQIYISIVCFKTMNNRNNNSLITTLSQFGKDFYSWIRGHENLYQCLLKIKHFIVNNPVLLFCLLLLYYRFNIRYFILFLFYHFIVHTNY